MHDKLGGATVSLTFDLILVLFLRCRIVKSNDNRSVVFYVEYRRYFFPVLNEMISF